jgi:TetR/AcrR family transcriptional regulator, cholesterol catabolism regulator
MEETGTKEKILHGAVELFMKYGLRSISMDDIARHLTVSKKTLYQHFADKEDLITLVLATHIEVNRKQYEAIAKNAKNAIDELAQISVCLRKDMTETNPSVLFDLQKFHPKAWEVWLNHKNKYIYQEVVRNIKQGIEEGYYRADVNPEVLAAIRIELISMGFDQTIFPQSSFSLAEVQSQIFDHFVYGLCTDKGKKLYQKHKEQNHQHA